MPALFSVVIIQLIPKEVLGSIKSDSGLMPLLSLCGEEGCGSGRTLFPFFACHLNAFEYAMLPQMLGNRKLKTKRGEFISHPKSSG